MNIIALIRLEVSEYLFRILESLMCYRVPANCSYKTRYYWYEIE